MANPNIDSIERIMSGPGPMAEKGTAMSHLVAKMRAARRQPPEPVLRPAFRRKQERLPDDWLVNPRNLWLGGYYRYMLDCERKIIDEARHRIAEERPYWRQRYMEWVEWHLARETDPNVVRGLKLELYKVRRILGLIKPTPETIRAQTRERVQRHRIAEKKAPERQSRRTV
jgi:hypothetical protein